ncbi:MAG: hypothetical protein LBT46_13000 [Planctomycetaceae bacterium]|jgi:hypothetical protein|nr:hypothetical protein [Planctomycetaceae bacterium]
MISRRQIYTILITVAAALVFGRILAVNRTDTLLLQQYRFAQISKQLDEKEKRLRNKNTLSESEIKTALENTRKKLERDARLETPVFSANDRSRWDTIRVLVEPDMRVKDSQGHTVWYAIDKVQNEKNWDTIDMVKHTGHLYSSKPPLLPTVMAFPYYCLYQGSGQHWSLGKTPFLVVRIMLVLCNLIPLIICWILLAILIERFGTTDWGRVFTMTFVCFGTFISTFAVTLNNHLPAVFCITAALYCTVRLTQDDLPLTATKRRIGYYAAAGFFSACAAACELPALLFCVLIVALLLLGRKTCGMPCPDRIRTAGIRIAEVIAAFVGIAAVAGAFFVTNYAAHSTCLPAYSQKDWYIFEYERGGVARQSYWQNPSEIDKGEASRAMYVLHCTLGHHGLFSLTPVWILSFTGLFFWLCNGKYRFLAAMILSTSAAVFAFYMVQEQPNRNYGGMTSALRWIFWLMPLWCVPLVSAADWCSRTRLKRAAALLCLAVSVMSAAYPVWNPWTHPWLYNLVCSPVFTAVYQY